MGTQSSRGAASARTPLWTGRAGRRNRYQVQAHLPLPDPVDREPAIGDVLAVLMGEVA